MVDVPNTACSRFEEPIQHVPRKVVGLLKKEIVLGVSASKNASACWTKDTIFTWGTNLGQLGATSSLCIFLTKARAQVMIRMFNLYKCYQEQ